MLVSLLLLLLRLLLVPVLVLLLLVLVPLLRLLLLLLVLLSLTPSLVLPRQVLCRHGALRIQVSKKSALTAVTAATSTVMCPSTSSMPSRYPAAASRTRRPLLLALAVVSTSPSLSPAVFSRSSSARSCPAAQPSPVPPRAGPTPPDGVGAAVFLRCPRSS